MLVSLDLYESLCLSDDYPHRSSLSTAAGAASKPSSSFPTAEKQEDNVVCYHSSSAEHFVAGSTYLKMVQSYVMLFKKYDDPNERLDAEKKFFIDKKTEKL